MVLTPEFWFELAKKNHFKEFSEPKFAMTSLTGHCKFERAENSLQLSNSGKKAEVSCSSAGDARIYATEEFHLRSSSAGSIYYKGEGQVVNSHTSSAGSIVKK